MYHRPRLIPCLLLSDGGLVKTVRFKDPNYLGDPINAVKIFSEKCVDELCVQDIQASREGRGPDFALRGVHAPVLRRRRDHGGAGGPAVSYRI